ncbi:DUF466 domain-containing protein [Rhodococcus rhodnii]|uniref:DUF466 domain-containing protein n=1 Tax=Rhodococcus rhodnii TaxID=38312 RepID=A0A6P2CM14_9NOCA|nr:DUF466 domain-containing protein [Rhodococcus rhodnii]
MVRTARRAWWWVAELMGDHDYARYVEFTRRDDPAAAVLTEREYWRQRHDDSQPQSRCC